MTVNVHEEITNYKQKRNEIRLTTSVVVAELLSECEKRNPAASPQMRDSRVLE